MTRRNWALAIILIALTAVFALLVSQKGPAGNIDVDKNLFTVADTAALEKIILRQPGGVVQTLEKRNDYWLLNGEHAADPAIMRLMLSMLNQVQVKRPVARTQQEEVLNTLEEQGVEVELVGATPGSFVVGGRPDDRISYFATEEEAYVMELPGYSSYISGLFYLTQSDLRNKLITTLNSLNFQALDVEYPGDTAENVRIRFENNMLGVADVARPDSSILFQYMMIFEPLQISGYYTRGEDPVYDSLLQTPPLAIFKMRTVGNAEGVTLQLYPKLPGKPFRLGYLPQKEEAVLLDERLAQAMLLRRRDLLLK